MNDGQWALYYINFIRNFQLQPKLAEDLQNDTSVTR